MESFILVSKSAHTLFPIPRIVLCITIDICKSIWALLNVFSYNNLLFVPYPSVLYNTLVVLESPYDKIDTTYILK